MPLRIVDAVSTESQPVGRNGYAVPDEVSSVEHIYFHRGISHHASLHGQCLEAAVKVYFPLGTSLEVGGDALHVVVDEAQVRIVGINMKVERAIGLDGIDIALHMGTGHIFFPDAGIEIDAFYRVMPFPTDVGIAQQPVVQPKPPDVQVGGHYRIVAQHAIGIGRPRGFASEVHAQVGNVEHIPDVNVLQVDMHRVFWQLGQRAMNPQVAVVVAEIEVVNMHFARINHDL